MTDPFGQPATPQFTQPPSAPMGAPPNVWNQANPSMGHAPQTPDQWAQNTTSPDAAPADTSGFFGGGGAALSFADRAWFNKPRGGQVLAKRLGNQTVPGGQVKTWDDGSPRKQLIVTLQTNERTSAEDDGKRELYIKGDLVRAVREELRAKNVNDVQIGAWIYVAWTGEKPTNKGNPMKLFSAQYTPVGSPPPALASAPVQLIGGPPAAPTPPVDMAALAAQSQAQVAQQAAQAAGQQLAAMGMPNATDAQIAAFMAAQAAGQQPAAVPAAPPQPAGHNPFG